MIEPMHNEPSTWSHLQIFFGFLNIYQTLELKKNLGLVVPNLSGVKGQFEGQRKALFMKMHMLIRLCILHPGLPATTVTQDKLLSLFLICKMGVCEWGEARSCLIRYLLQLLHLVQTKIHLKERGRDF